MVLGTNQTKHWIETVGVRIKRTSVDAMLLHEEIKQEHG